MGERGSVLVHQKRGHPGWAATRVLEQVQGLLLRLVQESERGLRE